MFNKKHGELGGLALIVLSCFFIICACDSGGGTGPFSRTKTGLWIKELSSGHYGQYRVYLTTTSGGTTAAACSNSLSISGANAEFELYTSTGISGGIPQPSNTKWLESGSFYIHIVDMSRSEKVAVSASSAPFSWGDGSIAAGAFGGSTGLTLSGFSTEYAGSYRLYISSNQNTENYKNTPAANASLTINSNSSITVPLKKGSSPSGDNWGGVGTYYAYLETTGGDLVAFSDSFQSSWGNATLYDGSFSGLGLKVTGFPGSEYGQYSIFISTSSANHLSSVNSVTYNINSSNITIPLGWSGFGNYYVFFEKPGDPQVKKKSSAISFSWGNGSVSYAALVDF